MVGVGAASSCCPTVVLFVLLCLLYFHVFCFSFFSSVLFVSLLYVCFMLLVVVACFFLSLFVAWRMGSCLSLSSSFLLVYVLLAVADVVLYLVVLLPVLLLVV